MKTINVSEASGPALDWLVAKCEDQMWDAYDEALNNDAEVMPPRASESLRDYEFGPEFSPSTDWAQGGPILERERLLLRPYGLTWECSMGGDNWFKGPTPLIAAMRVYVMAKLGREIEVPEELT